MKVSECMTREVEIVDPDTTLQNTARIMAEIDAGILPVSDGERLIGIITDRDIAVRGVALGRTPDTRVGDVMSQEVLYCFEDQDVEDVLVNMGEIQVRRLPVVDRTKRLCGIVSLSDLAPGEEDEAGEALCEISRPSGLHSQAV